jgi:NAD-dependent SIR2 family protein deacetylase
VNSKTAQAVRAWLDDADRVLITAGAGLSAAAGYDYADTARFAELFPAFHRRGLRARYQLIGLDLPQPLLWGYWAAHLADIRFDPEPNPLYTRLRAIIGDRDHFVMTSNVDALFKRNGFDPDRIWTPQGDYGRYQCDTPCTRRTWETEPIVRTALAAHDPDTGQITDPDAIPRCPNCGGTVFPNVRKGPEFIDDPYLPGREHLAAWLDAAGPEQRTLVLDIGSGFNTPSVIRWPAEHLAYHQPQARLIRVNRDHPEVPTELADRALPVQADAADFIRVLTA